MGRSVRLGGLVPAPRFLRLRHGPPAGTFGTRMREGAGCGRERVGPGAYQVPGRGGAWLCPQPLRTPSSPHSPLPSQYLPLPPGRILSLASSRPQEPQPGRLPLQRVVRARDSPCRAAGTGCGGPCSFENLTSAGQSPPSSAPPSPLTQHLSRASSFLSQEPAIPHIQENVMRYRY